VAVADAVDVVDKNGAIPDSDLFICVKKMFTMNKQNIFAK